jgi:pyruvate/2-oxoglutarate dehydrogenase complex dihydrolipoamide acyltransferase (E2) component
MDIAAETSGVMGAHKYQVNDEVPAGNTIAVILGPGESE